ncbi:MAG: TetR/AcrR family transcriptional regulator [Endozoicomonas sp.]
MEATNCEATNSSFAQVTESEDRTSSGSGSLNYQGRKTSRVNSEQRRRTILEAALRIVIRDGVRGVRHRAVAREAEVPLSATTYYFKDISDLITDTFTLFVEMGAEKFKAYWEESDHKLTEALSALEGHLDSGALFVDRLTDLAVEYVVSQLEKHRDYLVAERAFQLECLRNDKLRPVAFNHQNYLMQSLKAFFARIGSSQPEVDARLLNAVIMQVEYEGLVKEGEHDVDFMRVMLKRQLEMMYRG